MERILQKEIVSTGVSLSNLLAVVVMYQQPIGSCTALVSLQNSAAALGQVLDVLVYDNSPLPQDENAALAFPNLACTYIHDVSNPGVSKAYNKGADQAQLLNKQYLLLADQDTDFPVHGLQRYLDGIEAHPQHLLFCPILLTSRGIYSPTLYYFRRGMVWADAKPGVHSLKNRNILNSGLLVQVEAFQSIGGYNEKIELYFSDFDFVNRFRKVQNEMVVIDLVCAHSLSDIDNVDLPSAKRRFKHYVTGSYHSSQGVVDYIYLFATIFLRAVKLSWRYRSGVFLQLFFKQYVF